MVEMTGMVSVASEVSISVVWAWAQFMRMWPEPGTSEDGHDGADRGARA